MHWKDHDEFAAAPIRQLISRRLMLLGTGAAALVPALASCQTAPLTASATAAPASRRGLDFVSLPLDVIDTHAVPDGYEAEVLIRWGDPLRANGPAFTPGNLTATAQGAQFGFNCDYVAFVPQPGQGAQASKGVLVVNHEYATLQEMTPAGGTVPAYTADTVALEQEAVGLSVVPVSVCLCPWRALVAAYWAGPHGSG